MDQAPSIRAANRSDAPLLASVCAEAFPGKRRWLSPVTATRWWGGALGSLHAETWILDQSGAALGFVLIVHDEPAWNADKPNRRPRPIDVLRAGPRLWFARDASSTSPNGDRAAPALPPQERVWIELVALCPSAQGRGLGSRMLALADERAAALGRRAIRLTVDETNSGAHAAYERTGYVHDGDRGGQRVYTKHLVD